MTSPLHPRVVAIVPARYESSRFPGKPLALLAGKPVLRWVWDALGSMHGEVDAYIATDDARIARVAEDEWQAKVILTSAQCQSGTDRCGEALKVIADRYGRTYDLVLNVQGDEPFVDIEQLRMLMASFADPAVAIATLATPITTTAELRSPNNVKVVCGDAGGALYFSRLPIPYQRDVAEDEWLVRTRYLKHVGIYAYRTSVLEKLCLLPPSPLEKAEKLEQLRWLAAGFPIHVCLTPHANIGIDTPADLQQAEEYLKQNKLS